MKINNHEQELRLKEQEDQLKRLGRNYEKRIRAREAEIDSIEEFYDKKADLATISGEDQYIQALDRNAQRIVGVSKEFEDKIQGYKDRLNETQKKVEQEEQNIKSSEKEKLFGLKQNLENEMEDFFNNTADDQRIIEQSTKNSLADLSVRSSSEKRAMELQGQFEISALSQEYGKKTADAETGFRARMDNDLKNHKRELAQQKDELKINMLEEHNRLKRLGSEQTRIQSDQLAFMNKHQQNIIKQKTDDFKVRYEKMVQEHDTIIKQLEQELHSDMKKMLEKSTSERRIVASKNEDQFYRIEKLTPQMIESTSDVQVSLQIPEHEKENVHLSAQGRNIKMTLTRKFSDSLTSPDGGLDKSTRSELFSKEISTKDLLNSNKITQKYDQGVLTFRIQKL